MFDNKKRFIIENYNKKNPDHQVILEAADNFTVSEQYQWVIEGRYDAAFVIQTSYDTIVAAEDGEYHDYADQLSYVPYEAIPTYPLFAPGEDELAAAYDEAWEKLYENGTLDELQEKYFGYNVFDLIPEGCKIMVVGTVQEEDCDGLCWQYIINEDKIRPEFVVSTEPTDGGIYRGQRGRMEIRVDVKGVSCHGSAPERGDNAIYKMADILQDIRSLNENDDADETEIKGLVKMLNPKYNKDWEEARFLGRGTVTVSQIFYTSPSRCAVADSCAISLDRRMTFGETWESCLDEIRALPSVQKYGDDVKVSMYNYDRPSYTGCVYEIECYFPTWAIPKDHKVTKSLEAAYTALYGDQRIGAAETLEMRQARPLTDKWTFSTNGVSIMGRNNIPCIGFGPGAEAQAHAPNEKTWKQDLVTCAAVYAALPKNYME